jgi:hypothetical protein
MRMSLERPVHVYGNNFKMDLLKTEYELCGMDLSALGLFNGWP